MSKSRLIDILREAVAAQCEGTVGAVLSGGLDSSTVVALAPRPLETFTGYYDAIGYDERQYARLAARGTHHEILITPQDFVDNFDAMNAVLTGVARRQGPGAFGQYMVAKYVANHVSIVVSGEGSDELFGGYARTLLAAGEAMPPGYENYRPPVDYPVRDLAAALQYDLDRLPDLLAVDVQMCGAFGIESRSPFTDQSVVDYALALPATERVGKRHLRAAVRGIVPDAIIDRREKMGFPIPLVAWAQTEPVRTFVMDRAGYLPDPAKPFARTWWYDLLSTDR